MTRILALLTSPLTAASVLSATACFTAQTGPAEIALLHPRPDMDPDYMPTEDVYTEAQRHAFEAAEDEISTQLAQQAAGWAQTGLPSLREERGKVSAIALKAAASADIVILGTPQGDMEAKTILGKLLCEAGKPVLLVPRTMPRSFGQTVAIGWHTGCAAAGRAIESVGNLLLAARQTVILIGDEGQSSSAPPEDLVTRLDHAGKPARVQHFPARDRHIGEALLHEARANGADLLVMGAFSHGQLREFFFGGATSEVLKELDLPVLMHH